MNPINVSTLNSYIASIIKTDPMISNVYVRGEISNLKLHDTGHIYFSLKDEKSTIRCFFSSYNAQNLRYEIEDGMQVIALGYVNVFERGGYYSFNIKGIEPDGKGALAMAFEKVKKKLEAEGLFDKSKKKALPKYPKRIAIVTAKTGAALQDMLKIIKSKNDYTDIFIYPVSVQGDGASKEIADAIKDINENFPDNEVIIIGRGGGSQEDLWAFNEECVARAISDSKIPVISAVGHETDFTIADFVADVRAETPTAAAQMAVFDIYEVRENLRLNREFIYESLLGILEKYFLKFKALKSQLESLNPQRLKKLGFTTVTDIKDKKILSVDDVKINDILKIKTFDGEILVEVKEIIDTKGNENAKTKK